jgi:hypothetical protein
VPRPAGGLDIQVRFPDAASLVGVVAGVPVESSELVGVKPA